MSGVIDRSQQVTYDRKIYLSYKKPVLINGLFYMVREARFELAQDCSRQPLKLVRLPFRHSRKINAFKDGLIVFHGTPLVKGKEG